jgi:hypothetical protein
MDGGMSGYGVEIRALFLIDTIGFALSIAALGVERSLAGLLAARQTPS